MSRPSELADFEPTDVRPRGDHWTFVVLEILFVLSTLGWLVLCILALSFFGWVQAFSLLAWFAVLPPLIWIYRKQARVCVCPLCGEHMELRRYDLPAQDKETTANVVAAPGGRSYLLVPFAHGSSVYRRKHAWYCCPECRVCSRHGRRVLEPVGGEEAQVVLRTERTAEPPTHA